MSEFKDKYGSPLNAGDHVIHVTRRGSTVNVELRTVDRIQNGKLFLDGSKGSPITNFLNVVKAKIEGERAVAVIHDGAEPMA